MRCRCECAYDDVCRQLAFHSAGDRVSFDVVILSYSLMTLVLVQERLAKAVATAKDAEAMASRDAVGSSSALPPRNGKIVDAALRIIFDEMVDGLWPAGQPIFLSRGAGNNVGNAYVFSPDLLASLLEVLPAHSFRPHLEALGAHVNWLESHVVEEVQMGGALLRGWRSNHLPPDGGPIGWSTGQALRCISRLRSLLKQLLVADVLADLGGRPRAEPDPSAWARLLDSDLPPAGTTDVCDTDDLSACDDGGGEEGDGEGSGERTAPTARSTLKATIEERMIVPLSALSCADPLGRYSSGDAADHSPSSEASAAIASYSAILFGPPGTAKTTVVEAIARRLGFGFVTIDTSSFLQDGMANVASRISHVFEKLLELEDVVVLFDEVEEFMLDRSNPALTMESRMLTTAMLTKLADLRGARKVAFFVATNRLTALDAAATRVGRFDMQLFVGTPNLPARMKRFDLKLTDACPALSPSSRAIAKKAFEALLAQRWATDAMFLTFLETERLAADAAGLVAARAAELDATSGSELEREDLAEAFEAILDSQAAVMTVRGSTRDDFLESRGLSRI